MSSEQPVALLCAERRGSADDDAPSDGGRHEFGDKRVADDDWADTCIGARAYIRR
jgi:hypothetical protein